MTLDDTLNFCKVMKETDLPRLSFKQRTKFLRVAVKMPYLAALFTFPILSPPMYPVVPHKRLLKLQKRYPNYRLGSSRKLL